LTGIATVGKIATAPVRRRTGTHTREENQDMRRDVEFRSGEDTVRGWLYTPDDDDGPWPVIVMAGGWCYVKELVQPAYAEMYSDAGLAALLFDYRNFGSSDGARRQHIDPHVQIEDYRNAISFAETLNEVDSDRTRVREPQHDRVGRAADVLQRRTVPVAAAEHPDARRGGRERRSHPLGPGDRRLQPNPDAGQAAGRGRGLHAHDALQRSIAPESGRRGGDGLVHGAPAQPAAGDDCAACEVAGSGDGG